MKLSKPYPKEMYTLKRLIWQNYCYKSNKYMSESIVWLPYNISRMLLLHKLVIHKHETFQTISKSNEHPKAINLAELLVQVQ